MEHALKVLEYKKIIDILVENTSSNSGKKIISEILPETDIKKVNELLSDTEDGCQVIRTRGNPPLAGIKDIRESVKLGKMGSVLSPKMLLNIADTLYAGHRLKKYISSARIINDEKEKINTIINLVASINKNTALEDSIKNAIISEEEISDNASSELRNIRRKILSEQDGIKDKLNSVIKSDKYKTYIQEDIVTMRDGRYVIPIKTEYKNEVKGMVHDISTSGATTFIEPLAVLESNNKIKELKIKERKEIERILKELSKMVMDFADELYINYDLLINIDIIFAKAKLSLLYNCTNPKINDTGYINIKKGRHPLINQKDVVPIDFWIGKDYRALVVTGPNTGGKTVAIKTIGLLTLMAQSGLHIPANEGSHISVYKNIFADIGDEQSIEQSLSTFSSHMTNIVGIIKNANKESMVLLDELGSGTDPNEGSALAASILETLYNKGVTLIATTHYSKIKVFALKHEGIENACCEFDINTLKPTYKLLIGIPGKSNALLISKKLGLPDDVIRLSRSYLDGESMEFEDVLHKIEEKRSESEKERLTAKLDRIEIEKLKNDIEKEKKEIKEKKNKILTDAREEAKRILYDTRENVKGIIQETRKLKDTENNKIFEQKLNEVKSTLNSNVNKIEMDIYKESINKEEEIYDFDLKPGDCVYITSLDQKGDVLSKPDKNDEVMVQVGIMKVSIKRILLKKIDEQKANISKMQKNITGSVKSKNITLELDLRGQNVEESIALIEKYLDDANISGLSEVTLIHGKGTGVLRAGIHKFLSKSKQIKEFRLGTFGEGEDGVTVVTLK